jgi:hypothetical protein
MAGESIAEVPRLSPSPQPPSATHALPHAPRSRLLIGTSIEDKGKSPEEIFEADIAPILDARPDLWPSGGGTGRYESFRHAAEMVQSRAFHMKAENWVTGDVQVGGPADGQMKEGCHVSRACGRLVRGRSLAAAAEVAPEPCCARPEVHRGACAHAHLTALVPVLVTALTPGRRRWSSSTSSPPWT